MIKSHEREYKVTVLSIPGPPDVEQPCEPSLQAWSPDLSLYDTNVTSPCPDIEGCTLTLSFLHPVVPHALTLWVTYITSGEPSAVFPHAAATAVFV